MTQYKKQHTVPRLLQRFFSIDSKTIGCYYIKSGKSYQSPISRTAQKANYYKANEEDKTSVELAYGDIEDSAKPVLDRIQNRDFNLNKEEIDLLFFFTVTQLMRVPKAANAMGAVLDFCIKKGIKEVCEEVDSGLRNKTNLPMQAAISIPRVVEDLNGKGFLYVLNDTKTKFLLSDNPACLFSPVAEIAAEKQIEDLMLVQEPFSGYMLFLPLGPSVGFLCFDDDYYKFEQSICLNATDADVKMLNTLEVVNASDIIMYQEGTFAPDDIKDALAIRETDKAKSHQDSIYTPIDKSFALTGLNLDEVNLVYLMNRYAIEKRKKKNDILGW